ncbi:MAG: hypothetical protein U0X39_10125 [Bacteroidales bacterium]
MLRKFARLRRDRFKGNILNAKTIGLVWDASNPNDFQAISQFFQKMQERDINVTVIGYYPDKIIPDRLTAIRYLTLLKRDDLDFFYKPVSRDAEEFLRKKFDILIDINPKNVFALQYLSYLSLAGMKVGIFDSNFENHPFDLMLQLGKNSDPVTYLTQAVHYLEKVNTTKVEKVQ